MLVVEKAGLPSLRTTTLQFLGLEGPRGMIVGVIVATATKTTIISAAQPNADFCVFLRRVSCDCSDSNQEQLLMTEAHEPNPILLIQC